MGIPSPFPALYHITRYNTTDVLKLLRIYKLSLKVIDKIAIGDIIGLSLKAIGGAHCEQR
jgi:hypothetical protein